MLKRLSLFGAVVHTLVQLGNAVKLRKRMDGFRSLEHLVTDLVEPSVFPKLKALGVQVQVLGGVEKRQRLGSIAFMHVLAEGPV